MTTQPIRKYNPGFLTVEELVDTFCVRQVEFQSVLETLRDCTGPANQPQIVIGPRGSGKTTLLLRVAAEVRRDAALSACFFPVLLAEESYEVSTAAEFWLECLSQLADQAPNVPEQVDLHRTTEALRGELDDQSLADRCLGALLDFADRENKRLVLFVENLNMMFRDMADSDAGWRLRKVLQTEPRIVLLASATSRFDEMDHPDHALYDMFRVCALHPLDTSECAALWHRVSGRSIEERAIRSLEILTGGSPRLLAIVARFGGAKSFRQLMVDLLDLVDDHTEYFKSHIEALPPQERRVYLALADLWRPVTTREVAERCRLGTSKCSAQLTRLIERGVVRVAGGTVRRKTYYLTERLYNIYYLLRRRRGNAPLVTALIRFMQACYEPPEFEAIIAQMRRELDSLDPEMSAIYETTLAELEAGTASSAAEDAISLFNRGLARSKGGQIEDALAAWDEAVRRFGTSVEPAVLEVVARAMVSQGTALGDLNRPAEALAVSSEFLRRFGGSHDSRLVRQVAKALVNKGAALAQLDRSEDALETWEQVAARFGSSEEPDLRETVAMTLVNRARVLSRLHRRQRALAALDEVVVRFGESKQIGLLHQVAIALVNKGAVLREDNRPEEALVVSNEVVRRFGRTEHPELRGQVAKALLNKGVELVELGRPEEALAAWEDVGRRCGAEKRPDLLTSVGKALSNKGSVLHMLGRRPEAIAVCDEIVRRFGNSPAPTLRDRVGFALALKGTVLSGMGRANEALAAFGEAVRRSEENAGGAPERWKDMAQLGCLDIQLKARAYESAMETAGRVLGDGHPKRPEVAWRAYAGRAEAAFATGDAVMGERDTENILAILPDLPKPPYGVIRAAMILSLFTGPEKMVHLIEASPAKDFLLPLATALRQELGERPRVAVEVEEVAKDLRRDLAKIRQTNPAPTPVTGTAQPSLPAA